MYHINRNFPYSDQFAADSFLGKLHEEYVWDDEEYEKLEKEIYKQFEILKSTDDIPREIAWSLTRIFSYLMLIIGCHLDPNDGFTIKSLTAEQIIERRERLQLIFEGFFKGEMPNENILGY